MEIELHLDESIEKNASRYYEKAKKLKKKREGLVKAIIETKKKLSRLEKDKVKLESKPKRVERKKDWFEKFRWFYSSEGFLCIGGRDATSNEIVVKKHMEASDIVFHTDMAGSPFFVIKGGQSATESTLNETAVATASYAKAWKLGLSTLDVFYVLPSQVTKQAKSGEYMAKGSFMVYGDTTYLHPELEISVGYANGRVVGGPTSAISKQTDNFLTIVPGKLKTSDVSKKIAKKLQVHPDDVMPFIPPGGSTFKKA